MNTTPFISQTTHHNPSPDRVDACGTRLRLRALHVMGHGSRRIARALGVSQTTITELVRGDARTVSPHLRDAVIDLYDAWWDKRAPDRQLPAGFALVIRGGCAPVIARLPRAWRNPAYRRARRLHADASRELPPAPQWSEPVIPRHVPTGTFTWN